VLVHGVLGRLLHVHGLAELCSGPGGALDELHKVSQRLLCLLVLVDQLVDQLAALPGLLLTLEEPALLQVGLGVLVVLHGPGQVDAHLATPLQVLVGGADVLGHLGLEPVSEDGVRLLGGVRRRLELPGLQALLRRPQELLDVLHLHLERHRLHGVPRRLEQGLEAVEYYDPPNFTYPFGAYVCVVDIDRFTGEVKIRRFYALDDCGTRINPMIIEGQVHGGLTEALAIALGQELAFDQDGNILSASFMDYFLPTAVETPHWETDFTVTPSPHHPIGAKGVGESPNVGGVSAISNAVIDAFAHKGVTHMQMPHTAYAVWKQINQLGLNK